MFKYSGRFQAEEKENVILHCRSQFVRSSSALRTTMPRLTFILILFPNGAVGAALFQALLTHRSQFRRRAAINNTDRPTTLSKEAVFTGLSNQGFDIVSGSYTTVSAFTCFDVVLMPLGNHGIYLQPQIIDAAIEAGVRHFYPVEWGADLSVGANLRQRYNKDKAVTRSHLAKRAHDVERARMDADPSRTIRRVQCTQETWNRYPKHEAGVYGNEGRQTEPAMYGRVR